MTTVVTEPTAQDSQLVHLIAKMLWAAPALLLLLTINQVLVAIDISDTLENGTPAIAKVTDYHSVDRADVTFGYVSLTVEMEDGTTIVKEKMALPHTLLPAIEGETELPVVVSPGADQEVVIQSIAGTQWKIAAIQSIMAFVAFILSAIAIYSWNKYLANQTKLLAKES